VLPPTTPARNARASASLAVRTAIPLRAVSLGRLASEVGQVTPVFALVGAALGIGALVPRFERRASMSIERAHPSMVALLAFTMGAMVVGGVGFGLLWWTPRTASLGPAALAWLASLGVLAASGGGGYVDAVRRFDELTLDDV